jgi:hypothetical protein
MSSLKKKKKKEKNIYICYSMFCNFLSLFFFFLCLAIGHMSMQMAKHNE